MNLSNKLLLTCVERVGNKMMQARGAVSSMVANSQFPLMKIDELYEQSNKYDLSISKMLHVFHFWFFVQRFRLMVTVCHVSVILKTANQKFDLCKLVVKDDTGEIVGEALSFLALKWSKLRVSFISCLNNLR